MLLHAKRMLPEYISTILWPFALKCAEDRMNNLVAAAQSRAGDVGGQVAAAAQASPEGSRESHDPT